MKISFFVQNNCTNHLSNAMIVSDILRNNGIKLNYCFVNNDVILPDYFINNIGCEVINIETPLFYKKINKYNFIKSIYNNIKNSKVLFDNAKAIDRLTNDDDYIFNFNEPISFYYKLINKDSKVISISSDYWYLHKDSINPKKNLIDKLIYNITNRWVTFRSYKIGALSMLRYSNSDNISVLPPLINRCIFSITPEPNDYFFVCLNDKEQLYNFLPIIEKENKEEFILFTDIKYKKDIDNMYISNLTVCDFGSDMFIKYLSHSKGIITCANFYIVSLTFWMGKSTFVIPDHYDYSDLCNFTNYINNGISIGNSKEVFFDLFKRYHKFFDTKDINMDYKLWVLQTEKKILKLLT